MTRLIKLRAADRQALRIDAKSEANIIPRAQIVNFLKEGIRWGLNINNILNDMRVRQNLIDDWITDATTNNVALIFPPVPVWLELDGTKLNQRTDKNWWSKVVVTPESEPGAGDEVTRKRKWSEVRMLTTRTVNGVNRFFVPASDGVEYFNNTIITEMKLDDAVIAAIYAKDLPEADTVAI